MNVMDTTLYFHRIRWQRENGLMNKQKRRWFPKKPICEGGARGFTTVGIQEVKPALYLLVFGTLFSILLMFVELFAHRAEIWWHKYHIRSKLARHWSNVHKKLQAKH